MDPVYYKEYYDLETNHWWFKAREKIILQYLKTLIVEKDFQGKVPRILNIGCGPGRGFEYLSPLGDLTMIEYDFECCEFARQRTGLDIIQASITDIPFDNESFDFVCAFDVIEHVKDDALAIAEMKRVSKINGKLIITVPAFMFLWSKHDEINYHFRRYKLAQLSKLFHNGIRGRTLYSTYFNFFLFPPILLLRKINNLLKLEKVKDGSGSDFQTYNPGAINQLLYKIMSFESNFINRKMKIPFGVSILYSWQKEDKR